MKLTLVTVVLTSFFTVFPSGVAAQERPPVFELRCRGGPAITFGTEKNVGAIVYPGKMTEANGYYVCSMRIENLPLDKEITVHADIDQKDIAWNGGSEPKPPVGYQRGIIIVGGSPRVTLTAGAPTAVVNFEMIYAQIPTPPR